MSKPAVEFQRSVPLRLVPDPRGTTWSEWPAWAARQRLPLAVDLFAGGGGLSLGLEDAGFRVGLAADHDPWSVETHAANFQGLSVNLDLSDPVVEKRLTTLLKKADVTLVAGGPPCQPFSRAGRSAIRYLVGQGRRAAYDNRRDLWQVWLRVVLAARPRAVMLENVPDMALGDDFGVIRQIVDGLQGAGYETHLDIVQAPDYGIPQHRQRLILVALRDQVRPFEWPTPTKRVSIWQAISDLPRLGKGTGAPVLPYRARRRTAFQERARARVEPDEQNIVHDHVTRAVRDDDREAFKFMGLHGPNTRYSQLPPHLQRYRADTFNDKYKRHGKNELARSITAHIAKDGYWYIHPVEERTLTVREAARLQTFPDRYRFAGNRTHAFRQIGNAVPPLLAERIGDAILIALGLATAKQPIDTAHDPKRRPPRHFSRVALSKARERLDIWAERDARGAPWRHPTDPWSALVSSVLVNGRADDGTVTDVLWQLGGIADFSREKIGTITTTAAIRRALCRLLPAAEAWRAEQLTAPEPDGERWWQAVKLQPAEAERFACLALGDDVLLTTQASVRVAARITGRPVDKIDRLTDGRLALAEIVGGGPHAAKRMAAVAAIGRAVCTPEEPECGSCPFVGLCRGAARGA